MKRNRCMRAFLKYNYYFILVCMKLNYHEMRKAHEGSE